MDEFKNNEANIVQALDEVTQLVCDATEIARLIGEPLLIRLLEAALMHIARTWAPDRE